MHLDIIKEQYVKASDFIANFLAKRGITDAFGIPGGVILELLYAMERTAGITPHLCYHEQGAAFAASGYGQCGLAPGVVFAACGPGILNTLTPVADAYADSTPMLVFTAHTHPKQSGPQSKARFLHNQEIELEPIFSAVSKAYMRIDRPEELASGISAAYAAAMTGRKGPVVVDILSSLLARELPIQQIEMAAMATVDAAENRHISSDIARRIAMSRRPVLLLGEGVKLADVATQAIAFAEKSNIPVISSRYAQDIMPQSALYFGYIGTHGIRAANFILSKADLIVALGNRLAFPVDSASFRPLVEHTTVVRVDIDAAEFERQLPGTVNYCVDLANLMPALLGQSAASRDRSGWLAICARLRAELAGSDVIEPVEYIAEILRGARPETVVTSDVGSNEMWLSRGYRLAGVCNRILHSKTFGALGCSLPKAVGAQYACRTPVICFTGDQGLQMNLQELQAVASNRLPILIAVLNNHSSGMIREHEEAHYGTHYLLTTPDTGYAALDIEKIADAYGIPYCNWRTLTKKQQAAIVMDITGPRLLEVPFSAEYSVAPHLKHGDPCQKLFPYLDAGLYRELDAL